MVTMINDGNGFDMIQNINFISSYPPPLSQSTNLQMANSKLALIQILRILLIVACLIKIIKNVDNLRIISILSMLLLISMVNYTQSNELNNSIDEFDNLYLYMN